MSGAAFTLIVMLALLLGLGAVFSVGLLLQRSRGQTRLAQRVSPVLAATGDEFTAADTPPVLQKLARGGKALEGWVDPENESARLLVQCGWRSQESRLLWYLFQISIPLLGVGVVAAFWVMGPEKNKILSLLMLIFVVFALSVLIPRWILRSLAGQRRAHIKSEVPLFIHLLVLLFEAGLSARQAFASLVREGGGVLPQLGGEFELVLRQLEAGGDTNEVLKNMSDVLQVDDLTHVLGVLRQVDRYGGELREPLLETLAVLEERRSLDMREKVNLLSGRMTVVMVLFFFPALLIFVAGPAFLSIIRALGQVAGK